MLLFCLGPPHLCHEWGWTIIFLSHNVLVRFWIKSCWFSKISWKVCYVLLFKYSLPFSLKGLFILAYVICNGVIWSGACERSTFPFDPLSRDWAGDLLWQMTCKSIGHTPCLKGAILSLCQLPCSLFSDIRLWERWVPNTGCPSAWILNKKDTGMRATAYPQLGEELQQIHIWHVTWEINFCCFESLRLRDHLFPQHKTAKFDSTLKHFL